MLKPLTVWITTNWKILQEMGIPDHFTCLLRNLYTDQEATVRTWHGTTDWFQIGKGVHQFSSVQSLSRVRLFATSWLQHAMPPCPSPTPRVYSNSSPLSRWCHPTISSSVIPWELPPSIFLSIRVFSNESVFWIRWPKYWSFSFNITPSNGYSGLISFRMDWLYLFAVQGTLKNLLQHHSSKASILCSAL